MRKGLLLLILLAMPFSLCLETKAEGGDTAKANLARTYIEEFILTLRTNHKTLPQIKSAKVRQRVKDQVNAAIGNLRQIKAQISASNLPKTQMALQSFEFKHRNTHSAFGVSKPADFTPIHNAIKALAHDSLRG